MLDDGARLHLEVELPADTDAAGPPSRPPQADLAPGVCIAATRTNGSYAGALQPTYIASRPADLEGGI